MCRDHRELTRQHEVAGRGEPLAQGRAQRGSAPRHSFGHTGRQGQLGRGHRVDETDRVHPFHEALPREPVLDPCSPGTGHRHEALGSVGDLLRLARHPERLLRGPSAAALHHLTTQRRALCAQYREALVDVGREHI